MATINGEAVQGILRGVQLEDASGADVAPEFPPRADVRVRGLVLDDGETWVQIGASGGLATIKIVAEHPRERSRRGLLPTLRRVRNATRDGEVAAPADVQRLLLAIAAEVFGDAG